MKKIWLEHDWSGEWHRLIVDGDVFHEGHSIPDFIWIDLIETYFDAEVSEEEIVYSDDLINQ